MREQRIICPGCGSRFRDRGDLKWPPEDICERVLPGEPMPAGECPDCGALIPESRLRSNEEEF